MNVGTFNKWFDYFAVPRDKRVYAVPIPCEDCGLPPHGFGDEERYPDSYCKCYLKTKEKVVCVACKGTGKIMLFVNAISCDTCGGSGKVSK